ncbi:hypothetical protein [Actinokineospora bangkokensis]|uniref:Cysteine dioxygenase n=1 Tax=Actinokineospora bangkokensis TaxID=1193682 RepID=A0A1Q9LRL7_9PSEU|nr:hypothetical protein [Actinokineospora bangkokensis]OLR94669.1 hypothetical protein BJP25_13190 [Actinokineospora bangkokensis]
MAHPTRTTDLTELADLAARLRAADLAQWATTREGVLAWGDAPALRTAVRAHLRELDPERSAALVGRSRETTTHFAWCLRDRTAEPFTFWLHEYKPQRDWRAGYADSVHNHRYHFCTVILSGGYRHERFRARLDESTGLISDAELTSRHDCAPGESGVLTADQFHRIPTALDGTLTFLVKSRPVRSWSLSWDPATGVGHRHTPVESRLAELTGML